jgi:hypothetical protein
MSDSSGRRDEGNHADNADNENTETARGLLEKMFLILFENRAGMWTAIFTGVLSIFTYFLWNVAKSTDEASRASERAFINFGQLSVGVNLTTPNQTWVGQEFALNFINNGNTPASSVVITTSVQAWRTQLPNGYGFPEEKAPALAVIGPKSIYGTLTRVSKDDIMDAWQAKSHLFFWGSVVYKDIFPNDPDRLSEFCIEMTHITFARPAAAPPNPKAPVTSSNVDQPPAISGGVIAFQWQACPEHNCYDQDCKDYSARVKNARGE